MRILAVNGSPRKAESHTEILLRPMLDAARAGGAKVEYVYLDDLDVRPCTGCFSCWTRTPGRCILRDGGAAMLERLAAADVFVLGFPLHILGVPARVQAFLERLLPTAQPWLGRNGDAEGRHPLQAGAGTVRWLVLSNCGFADESSFDALRFKFRRLGVEPVCLAAGGFLDTLSGTPMLAEPWEALRGSLGQAGRELAQSGRISQETRALLERPIIEWAGLTAQQFEEAVGEYFRNDPDASPDGPG